MIEINNLTCSYEKEVLSNINLLINNKKITYIIGKNGSGKSTLCNILGGINKKFKGSIKIDDLELNKKTKIIEIRKRIGIVFQNPDNQIIFNTVYDDIKFVLENMKVKKDKIDSIIKKTLKIVDMEHHINSNPYKLSGGEKQRIAIASVLALNPQYIIFDESTSMLDVNGKKEIYKLLKRLKKEKIGCIFITNIMDELIYADEIIILDNKKAYKYTKRELFDNLNLLKKHGLELSFILKIICILKKKGISVYDNTSLLKELNKL